MKKKLLLIPFILVFMFNFTSFLSVSAYTGLSSFNSVSMYYNGSFNFNFSSNGILLIHSFFTTNVDVSSLPPSDRPLDLTYFTSGTWQGTDISNLSSSRLCDQSDTVGFSQTSSLCSDSSRFVYSVVTCLPCVAGDSFTIRRARSSYATSSDFHNSVSQLLGVTGLRKVYNKSSLFYSSDKISYTTTSDNQYYCCLFSSDLYTSDSGTAFNKFRSDYVGTDYSNLTFIVTRPWASLYTSTFGISKGTDISLYLKPDISSWNFSVYELFTDGSFVSGEDTGISDSSSSGSDLSGIEKLLAEILSVLKESAAPVVDPNEFWAVYKSGLEEMFGIEPKQPEEPPPEVSDSTDPTESTTKSPFELDQDQFDSAIEYVDTDQLGESISGPSGAIYFFWRFTDQFFDTFHLHTLVAISLIFCFILWLLRR